MAAQVLMNLGLKLEDAREEVLYLLTGKGMAEKAEEKYSKVPLLRIPRPPQTLAEREQIRSLEQQLWNVRIVLGALVGSITGVLLLAQFGAVMGLLLGGLVAALGWRTLGVLAGGSVGVLLGCTHLPNDGGALAGGLLGALVGFLVAEIGGQSGGRGFLDFWRKR